LGTNGSKITHFVVGVGTGGTISGVAKYLRRKSNIKMGNDTYGSVFKKIPRNRILTRMKFILYNRRNWRRYSSKMSIFPNRWFYKSVTDAAVYTRKIALEEGIL
jgi:cystathionine beta-synthase